MNTKQQVITLGLDFLQGIGADSVCEVCIANGGSCCGGCKFLKNGIGCQKRNTSCTSWLCGYLMFVFYEAGILFDWYKFWEQVPGKGYREDCTPPNFPLETWLEVPHIRELGEVFAKDLKDAIQQNKEKTRFVINLNDKLFLTFTKNYKNPQQRKRRLQELTKDFKHFHATKARFRAINSKAISVVEE